MHADAIVIKTTAMREHDRTVVLYTRQQGKLAAVAKGSLRARSKQSPALDDGTFLTCELVQGRGPLPIMAGAQAMRSWSGVKRSPCAWAVAQFFLQVIDAVVYDAQADEAMWSTLTRTLEALDAGQPPLDVLRQGQVAFLAALGYGTHAMPTAGPMLTALDEQFEWIAQRKLDALHLVYQLVLSEQSRPMTAEAVPSAGRVRTRLAR